MANSPHGRYVLSHTAVFRYRADEWRRTNYGRQIYVVRDYPQAWPGLPHLTAAWACPSTTSDILHRAAPNFDLVVPTARWLEWTSMTDTSRCAASICMATRSADQHRINLRPIWLIGSSGCPGPPCDYPPHPLLRNVTTSPLSPSRTSISPMPARWGRDWMAQGVARQTLPQDGGRHSDGGFRNRCPAQTSRHRIDPYVVNPAYTSVWGDQHWRRPKNATRHEAAATVIGRRAQGHKARRRKGVTRTRPEDRVVRATDQATHDDRQVSTRNRHQPGKRGTESRPPGRVRMRQLDRATVTPVPADNGPPHQ